MSRSGHAVNLGPCIVPIYPATAFSGFPEEIDFKEVWKLIGPTVEKNINGPLWKQFCAIYLEGLNHGSSAKA